MAAAYGEAELLSRQNTSKQRWESPDDDPDKHLDQLRNGSQTEQNTANQNILPIVPPCVADASNRTLAWGGEARLNK